MKTQHSQKKKKKKYSLTHPEVCLFQRLVWLRLWVGSCEGSPPGKGPALGLSSGLAVLGTKFTLFLRSSRAGAEDQMGWDVRVGKVRGQRSGLLCVPSVSLGGYFVGVLPWADSQALPSGSLQGNQKKPSPHFLRRALIP